MLEKFIKLAYDIKNEPKNKNLIIDVVQCEPSNNSAAYIDIETTDLIGRITFWESNDYCIEIINISTEEAILNISERLTNGEISKILDVFLKNLNILVSCPMSK